MGYSRSPVRPTTNSLERLLTTLLNSRNLFNFMPKNAFPIWCQIENPNYELCFWFFREKRMREMSRRSTRVTGGCGRWIDEMGARAIALTVSPPLHPASARPQPDPGSAAYQLQNFCVTSSLPHLLFPPSFLLFSNLLADCAWVCWKSDDTENTIF